MHLQLTWCHTKCACYCILVLQDFEKIMNPPENLASVNTVALILWDVFEARYGWGRGSIIVFVFPLGCSFFCALHGITSAARYAPLTHPHPSPLSTPCSQESTALEELDSALVMVWILCYSTTSLQGCCLLPTAG